MAPGLPSFGPHWRYITRIKAIAELVGASHVAAACEQTYARLSAVPEHHIDAVVHHHNIEAVEQAEDIGLLLDGLVTDAPLAIGLDAEASGETPDTRTTHYANVNALIERVRRGENIPAGPLDPELRCWMEAHVKAAAHKQNTLDHYIGMGHTVAHRFVVMQGTERTVDAFMLDALSAQNAYVVAMDFISLPAMSPPPLTGQMLTAADGRSFALLHFKDVDCLLDLNSRQQIACRRANNPQTRACLDRRSSASFGRRHRKAPIEKSRMETRFPKLVSIFHPGLRKDLDAQTLSPHPAVFTLP